MPGQEPIEFDARAEDDAGVAGLRAVAASAEVDDPGLRRHVEEMLAASDSYAGASDDEARDAAFDRLTSASFAASRICRRAELAASPQDVALCEQVTAAASSADVADVVRGSATDSPLLVEPVEAVMRAADGSGGSVDDAAEELRAVCAVVVFEDLLGPEQ